MRRAEYQCFDGRQQMTNDNLRGSLKNGTSVNMALR